MRVLETTTCSQRDGVSQGTVPDVTKDDYARLSYERFSQLSSNLTLVTDLDWKILQVNSNWHPVMGYTPAELEGRNFLDLIHRDDCKEVVDSLRKKHLIPKTIQFQVNVGCNDKTYRVIDFKSDVVPAEGLIFTLGRDVTHLQHTEEALRDSEGRRKAAWDTTGDGVVTIDEQGRIESINASVEKMFGYTWAELTGKNVSILMPQPYHQDHDGYLKHYLLTGEKHVMGSNREATGLRKDGTQFPIELAIGEFQTAQGRFFIGIIRDITARKQAEDLARVHQTNLHHASRLSTIGEMASGLAHEINQPLGAICSYADACKRMMRSGDQQAVERTIDKVAQQAERAGAIVRRIQRFVHKEEPKKSLVHVNPVLREMAGFIEADLRGHQIEIKLELLHSITPVMIDTIQLQQVILNLLRNAMDSIVQSDTQVREIVIQTFMDRQEHLIISVSDHGAGMTDHVLRHLFDPFFTTKPDGMGLGLSISQSIVQSCEGKMWVSSNLKGGVTFFISFPGVNGECYAI